MPLFKQQLVLEAAKNLRAFLNLEMGLTRGPIPADRGQLEKQGQNLSRKLKSSMERSKEYNDQLKRARQQIANKDLRITELQEKLRASTAARNATGSKKDTKGNALERIDVSEKHRDAGPCPRPDKVIWIFGSGRSGNTWLSSMLGELEGHTVWREPSVGRLFGEFYYLHSSSGQRGTHNYILGERQRKTWMRAIRGFVLENAGGRFPHLGDGLLVVKEHAGSIGAPLLVEALPESRVILLVRDPRDAVASALDGTRQGGWRRRGLAEDDRDKILADEDPMTFVEENARQHLLNVTRAKQAYDAHRGPKALIRYEELNADALCAIKRLYSVLSIDVGDAELVRAVEKHSWGTIPEDARGRGKFYRKASPGGWREDLTPEQAKTVERITAPLLKAFYT